MSEIKSNQNEEKKGNNLASLHAKYEIKSKKIMINPFRGNKKRRYINTFGFDLNTKMGSTFEGKCYNKLRKIERDLDVGLSRNKYYCVNNIKYDNELYFIKKMRILLFNTVKPIIVNGNLSDQTQWKFCLECKILDDLKKEYNALNDVISKIKVKMDENSLAKVNDKSQKSQVEWVNKGNNNDINGIEIERCGNMECKLVIEMYLKSWFKNLNNKSGNRMDKNVICKISKELNDIIGLMCINEYPTKSDILCSLGEYCRMNNLIKNDNSMNIICDDPLFKLFGMKQFYIGQLWDNLIKSKHVSSPDPITINHCIKINGSIQQNTKIYDIDVKLSSKIYRECVNQYIRQINDNIPSKINELNESISDVFEELRDQTFESDILKSYANDPLSTIDVLVSNQCENINIINEFCMNAKRKPNNYFKQSFINKSIQRYLHD